MDDMVNGPEKSELVNRARRVRLVVTDVDGVWTDAGVIFGNSPPHRCQVSPERNRNSQKPP
jgi:hypothetical protein